MNGTNYGFSYWKIVTKYNSKGTENVDVSVLIERQLPVPAIILLDMIYFVQ